MRPYLFLLLLSWLIPFTASAQQQERVFTEYLQYLMQEEGLSFSDAIKKVQSLQQGKESLIQSYLKTEADMENLQKSLVNIRQSDWDDYGTSYPQPEMAAFESGDRSQNPDDSVSDVSFDESAAPTFWASEPPYFESDNGAELKPPRFRLVGVREYTDDSGIPALDVTLQNSGSAGDVSVALATKDGVLIGEPLYRELDNVSGTKVVSFHLLQQPQQITIQLETDGGAVALPVFLRQGLKSQPVSINATPFDAECAIGESLEYRLILEGSPDNDKRYHLRVAHLPDGITSALLVAQTLYPVRSLKFSHTFRKHELLLRLSVTTDLSADLIGKRLPFVLSLAEAANPNDPAVSETLSITPLGVGKIIIDSPQQPISLSLGDSTTVTFAVTNIGSQDINSLSLFSDHTVIGLTVAQKGKVSLKVGERKEVDLTVNASNMARIGRYDMSLYVTADNIREQTSLPLRITARKLSFGRLAILDFAHKQPLLLGLSMAVIGCVLVLWLRRKPQKED